MIFDVYYAFRNKEGKVCPGIKPNPMEWAEIKSKVLESKVVKDLVAKYRAGDEESKRWLPSIGFVGACQSTRMNAAMIPTQLVMIDIDHCEDPKKAWEDIKERMTWEWICNNVDVAHISPSGKGLHIIFESQGYGTLKANMDWLNEQCDFAQYGDYDSAVHDFARISFAFPPEDLLFESARLFLNVPVTPAILMENPAYKPQKKNAAVEENSTQKDAEPAKPKPSPTDLPTYTEDEIAKMKAADWRGISLQKIIDAWVEYRGTPGPQEVHNYYNEHLKDLNWLDLPLPIPEDCTTSYYFYHIQTKNGKRDELAKYLRDRDIYTTYRYFPLHRVAGYGITADCPNADWASDNTLCLPMHQSLSEADLELIVKTIKEFSDKYC